VGTPHGAVFNTFESHTGLAGTDSKSNAITNGTRRCYLGGSDILNPGGVFLAADGRGTWLPWPGVVDPLVLATGRPDAAYLWPITRLLNPNFKGVIYVDHKVAISGQVRSRVTLAATHNIIVVDDLTYVTNPGAGTCKDILGVFSGIDVVIADNLIQDPIPPLTGQGAVTWDDSRDEFLHGVVLALDNFTVQQYNTGSTSAEPCSTTTWGRGCLYLTGGIIQKQRGAVGTSGGTGNLKRYSYDACAFTNPPPYFPTTGHFARGHYYEVEPTGFNIGTYWSLLIP
jgi:hypothetical protein